MEFFWCSWNGIENLIKHHKNNITKIVSSYNNEIEIVKIKNGKLHSLLGPSYVLGKEKQYYIEGKSFTENDYYKQEEVINTLREHKLKRILE